MLPRTRRSVEFRRSGGPFMTRRARRRVRGALMGCDGPRPGEGKLQHSLFKPTRVTTRTDGPTVSASILLGAAIGLVVAGLATRFHELFGEQYGSVHAISRGVAGAALMTLAVGVRVPQRFALWVCAVAWRRFLSRGRRSDMSGVLLDPAGADRPLYWVVLSVIALLAGIAMGLLPLSVRLTGAGYEWMSSHFLWSVGSGALLQAAVVFLAVLVPMLILGLAMSCAHHLSCPYGRWETRATAWLLIGAAAGTLIATWILRTTQRSDLMLIIAALPALLVSLVSAASTSSRSHSSPGSAEPEALPLPIWSDRWPTLLRASIVAVGGGGVFAIAVGSAYLEQIGGEVGVLLPAMLLAMGIGVLAGCRTKRSGARSIGGFGVACAMAGMSVAVPAFGITLCGADLPVWHLADWKVGPTSLAVVPACASLAAIGFAMAYGRQVLLHRVANRSFAGAAILTRMLVVAAMTVWVVAPLTERLVGRPAGLVMLGLLLLALGGTLIIHEPSYSPRTRGVRLCLVFGSIGTMMILSSLPPKSRRVRSAPVSAEPSSVSQSNPSPIGYSAQGLRADP